MLSIAALPIPGLVSFATAKPASALGGETPFKSIATPSVPSRAQYDSASSSASAASPAPTSKAAALITAFPGPRFTIDPLTDKSVLEVLNPQTGEVERQLPTKEALKRYELNAQHPAEIPVQVGTDLNGQG